MTPDELRKEYDSMYAMHRPLLRLSQREVKDILDAIEEYHGKRALATEALEPFAEWADSFDPSVPAHVVIASYYMPSTGIPQKGLIRLSYLYAARDALAQCQPDANPYKEAIEQRDKLLQQAKDTIVRLVKFIDAGSPRAAQCASAHEGHNAVRAINAELERGPR